MPRESRLSSRMLVTASLVVVPLVLVAAGLWAFVFRPNPQSTATSADQPSPDPRMAFETEYRNVRPGVKYVGDAECALCHRELCNSYHKHPMGRSASLVASIDPPEKLDAKSFNPFRTDSHELRVITSDRAVIHRMTSVAPAAATLPALEMPVQLALGSGALGRSYISLAGDSLWQSPISWFTEDQRWNVSPGFQLGNGAMRAVGTDCFFCHIDHIEPIPHSKNRFRTPLPAQLSIGCERCHGPGELHVSERLANQGPLAKDTSIVNPKHLDDELQKDICRQCHMLGESRTTHFGRSYYDFRPGLPLSHVMTIFVSAPEVADDQRSVGQFEQMEQSGCFVRGNGTMVCTTCHNPHESPAPEKKADYYRSRCMTCHEQKGCNETRELRNAQKDSCIACHMPQRQSHNVAHASITDHTIPRKKKIDQPSRGKPELPPGVIPLVRYQSGKYAPAQTDIDRDFAIALARKLPSLKADRQSVQRLASLARENLLRSVERWKNDDDALLSLASLSSLVGDHAARLQYVRQAVDRVPESEEALIGLAESEIYAGHFVEALAAADRLIAMVPRSVEYRLLRASVLIGKQDWKGAEATIRDAQTINPLSAESHVLRAMCLEALGRSEEAKKEFEAALALETKPEIQRQYRGWFRPKK